MGHFIQKYNKGNNLFLKALDFSHLQNRKTTLNQINCNVSGFNINIKEIKTIYS